MVSLESLGKVISTDILIIGGGIAGLVTAIKAKEYPVDVLIAEKQTTGWSGKAPKTGALLWVIAPDDNLDDFVEYHVRNMGIYLEDQELLYSYAKETYGAIEQLAEWGVKIAMDEKGKLDTFRPFHNKWSHTCVGLDMNLRLLKKARKMGVKTMDKIQIVELLRQDERVVGAVGFNIIDCCFYIIKAKATVLANGSCNYMLAKMWSAGRGDGIATAYRAGAEMRNAEYSNWTEIRYKTNLCEALHALYAIYNTEGELLCEKYNISEGEPDETITALLAMEKEVREGRGPIRLDESRMHLFRDIAVRHQKNKNWKKIGFMSGSYAYNYIKDIRINKPEKKPEAVPYFVGELGPIKVDHEMKTTLTGLWAVGDISWAGSGWIGARPPPGGIRGSGLMNAILSSLRAGPSIGLFASKVGPPEVDYIQIEQFKEKILAPIGIEKGILPFEIIRAIQDVICPFKYQLRRNKNRLEEALSKIEDIKHKLPKLWAKDGHGLLKCNEAKNMTLCAEMTFRAALSRKETRGWHVREDYPERDDQNWLKWVIVKQEEDEMVVSTEPIPIDKYRFKPFNYLKLS